MFGFQFLGKRLDMAGQFDNAAAHRDSDMCRVHTRRPPKVLENISPDRLISGHIINSPRCRASILRVIERRLDMSLDFPHRNFGEILVDLENDLLAYASVELLPKVSERSRRSDDHERRRSALADEPG